ncbi:type IV secretion system protein [Bartonella sp. B23]
MKKLFIVTGMVVFFGVTNLVLANDNGRSSLNSPILFTKEEYGKIIELLKKQVEASEEQVKKAISIYQSITGNRTRDLALQENGVRFFFQNPQLVYPGPNFDYSANYFSNVIDDQLRTFDSKVIFLEDRYNRQIRRKIRKTINDRLKYGGVVSKAVSLQAFQDAENRFTQIRKLLSEIEKTKNLKEVTKLQAHIKNVLAMIKNESIKMQMVAHLQNAEDILINVQKRKLYERFIDTRNLGMPYIKF